MNLQELYSLLFTDISFHTLFFMPNNNMLLDAAILFGKINKYHILLIATFASSSAQIINFYIGKLLTKAIILEEKGSSLARKLTSFLQRFGIVLGFISWIPVLGPVTVVLMGYKKVQIVKMLPSILIGNLFFYYVYIIL